MGLQNDLPAAVDHHADEESVVLDSAQSGTEIVIDVDLNKLEFTTGEAARICSVSQQTIIRCFDQKELEGRRLPASRFRKIPRAKLIVFMRNHGIPTDVFGDEAAVTEGGPDPEALPVALLARNVFTTGQAARICKCSQQKIIRCCDDGTLKSFNVPGSSHRRIPRQALRVFMLQNHIDVTAFDAAPASLQAAQEQSAAAEDADVPDDDGLAETDVAAMNGAAATLHQETL